MKTFAYWDDYSYDGAYEWPPGVEFTQKQRMQSKRSRPISYNIIGSHYFGFIDGSGRCPMGCIVMRLNELGIGRISKFIRKPRSEYGGIRTE
jgi:hypothetical protein